VYVYFFVKWEKLAGGKVIKKIDSGNGNIIPNKISSKFTRNNRGLFIDYNHIYSDSNLKENSGLLTCVPSIDGIILEIDLLKTTRA
jgi:hypothetical protein